MSEKFQQNLKRKSKTNVKQKKRIEEGECGSGIIHTIKFNGILFQLEYIKTKTKSTQNIQKLEINYNEMNKKSRFYYI